MSKVILQTGVSTYTTKTSYGVVHVHVNAKNEDERTITSKISNIINKFKISRL